MRKKLFFFLLFAVTGIIFSIGCIQQKPSEVSPGAKKSAWMDIELKDVTAGNQFVENYK